MAGFFSRYSKKYLSSDDRIDNISNKALGYWFSITLFLIQQKRWYKIMLLTYLHKRYLFHTIQRIFLQDETWNVRARNTAPITSAPTRSRFRTNPVRLLPVVKRSSTITTFFPCMPATWNSSPYQRSTVGQLCACFPGSWWFLSDAVRIGHSHTVPDNGLFLRNVCNTVQRYYTA